MVHSLAWRSAQPTSPCPGWRGACGASTVTTWPARARWSKRPSMPASTCSTRPTSTASTVTTASATRKSCSAGCSPRIRACVDEWCSRARAASSPACRMTPARTTWSRPAKLRCAGSAPITSISSRCTDPTCWLIRQRWPRPSRRWSRAARRGAVGVSNYTPTQTAALVAHLHIPLASLQPEFSPLVIEPLADGTLDLAMQHGISVLAWSPLAGGRLGAPGDDERAIACLR